MRLSRWACCFKIPYVPLPSGHRGKILNKLLKDGGLLANSPDHIRQFAGQLIAAARSGLLDVIMMIRR